MRRTGRYFNFALSNSHRALCCCVILLVIGLSTSQSDAGVIVFDHSIPGEYFGWGSNTPSDTTVFDYRYNGPNIETHTSTGRYSVGGPLAIGQANTEWQLTANQVDSMELRQKFSSHDPVAYPGSQAANGRLFFQVTETPVEFFIGGAYEGQGATFFADLQTGQGQTIFSRAENDSLQFNERGVLAPGYYILRQEYYGSFDGAIAFAAGPKGTSQYIPVLPTTDVPVITPEGNAQWDFPEAETGQWFDPLPTSVYDFAMNSSSLFTDILELPVGYSNTFQISAEGQTFSGLGSSDSFDFVNALGHGVSSFRISGINPEVDALDPTAFPVKLAFDTATASFSMTSGTAGGTAGGDVPEPASLAIFGTICLIGCGRRRRS